MGPTILEPSINRILGPSRPLDSSSRSSGRRNWRILGYGDLQLNIWGAKPPMLHLIYPRIPQDSLFLGPEGLPEGKRLTVGPS